MRATRSVLTCRVFSSQPMDSLGLLLSLLPLSSLRKERSEGIAATPETASAEASIRKVTSALSSTHRAIRIQRPRV